MIHLKCAIKPYNFFCLCLGSIAFSALGLAHASAQTVHYSEYPQLKGKEQQFYLRKLPSWITFEGEFRQRPEGFTAFNDTSGSGRVYNETREYLGVTVSPAPFLSLYLQAIDTHAPGLPPHLESSTQIDNFDLRQGYLDFHHAWAEVYAGRRDLHFGGERVIGHRDFTNNSRSFDGFFGHFGGKNAVDVFSTSVVTTYQTSLDKHGAGLTFHGAWGALDGLIPHADIEPFVLVRAQPRVRSQQRTFGTETEVTFGSEATGAIPGGLSFDVLGDLQRGSYSNDSIHSGAGYAKLAYLAQHAPWSPRFGGEYDYATGNPHTNPQRISTYDQLYPSNHNAFGLEDLFGFENITQSRINIDLGPTKKLSLLIQQEFLHVANTRDSVYSSSGSALVQVPAAGFASDYIGRGFDASAKYLVTPAFILNAGIDHFSPGGLLQENRHGASVTYAFLSFTYRFKLEKGKL